MYFAKIPSKGNKIHLIVRAKAGPVKVLAERFTKAGDTI
jgi:hypothetical protein